MKRVNEGSHFAPPATRLWQTARTRTLLVMAFIFVAALLPRATHPVSRPLVWSDRAFHFSNALLAGDWAKTYQHYHPGVTVMWLSGLGLQLFSQQQGGLTSDQLLGIEPSKPGVLTGSVIAGVIPLALVLAACITFTYPLLRRLAGDAVAFTGSFLLALDPFHISYSKVIHPDALLATFMLVSALLLLLYLQQQQMRDLIGSGFFAGLAFLSKTPAIFLLPYTGLLVGVAAAAQLGDGGWSWRQAAAAGGRILKTAAIWGATAVFTFVALWPAMWVMPRTVLSRIDDGIITHTVGTHMNPVYFMGESAFADPGLLFYLATIAWKSTAVTFPLLLLLPLLIRRRRATQGQLVLALLAYIFFFTIQMGLGQWKQIPYILPVAPALSVLAAISLVWLGDALAAAGRQPRRRVLLFTAALLAQALIVVGAYPYYGAHHNRLLGGSRVAQHVIPLQDNGEGLDKAGRFLSELPHGQMETAVILPRNASVFRRTFNGRVLTNMVPWARYRVYDVNQVMRQMGDDAWQEAWQADRQTEPLYTVAIDGVTYVWVYGEPPPDPVPDGITQALDYRLGKHIRLQEMRLSSRVLQPGDTLTIAYVWESDGQVGDSYTVFNHLLSPEQEMVAQLDSVPLAGIRPTQTWRAGEQLEDRYDIQLDESVPPGSYELSVGLYHSETIQRLPVFGESGERLSGDRIVLATIQVRP